MEMLELDRVDFAIEDEMSGNAYLQKYALKNIELHPYVVFESQVSLMFSRKSVPKKLVEKINFILESNKSNYQAILSQFVNP